MLKKKKKSKEKSKVSSSFVTILALVSIMSFLSIIFKSLFNFELSIYIESLILLALGIGFIIESDPKRLFKTARKRLNEKEFSEITTFVIGFLAAISGILSFPFINLEHFIFSAIKGVISIIAIIFIAIETWVIK